MENRCPLSYTLTLGAVLQVCPPSFSFKETLSWHNLTFSWEGGWREQQSVHCSGEGGTTVQRSGQHCPLKCPQEGLLRLPIPNPVRKWEEAHTTNGYSPAVKTVRTQGHLETLLYHVSIPRCVHLFSKWRAQLRFCIYEKILSSWFVQTPDLCTTLACTHSESHALFLSKDSTGS